MRDKTSLARDSHLPCMQTCVHTQAWGQAHVESGDATHPGDTPLNHRAQQGSKPEFSNLFLKYSGASMLGTTRTTPKEDCSEQGPTMSAGVNLEDLAVDVPR